MKERYNLDTSTCACGSGIPYEMCCKNKENPYKDDLSTKSFLVRINQMRKKYKKVCLHPRQNECGTMIHAHTISQKSVLSTIAYNGEVLMPVVGEPNKMFQMKRMGIEAKASKYYCFCDKHDRMFYPIDKELPLLNDHVFFLYSYRIFAYTFYKVRRELDCSEKIKLNYNITGNKQALIICDKLKRDFLALNELKKIFDAAIETSEYNCLTNTLVTLEYKINIAAAVCLYPLVDVFGGIIETDERYPLVYLTIVPNESQSRIIFSWLKKDDDVFAEFKIQIEKAPRKFFLKYLNNLLPLNCENMAINPLLWDEWNEDAKKDFEEMAYECSDNAYIIYSSETYFKKRRYNLFMPL